MSVVFALATPPAKSAICVFRVTGSGCHRHIKQFFKRSDFEFGRFYVLPFYVGNKVIDRVGFLLFKSPKSYTGEDSFEVHSHGGLGVMSAITNSFKVAGFDEAPPGEFTKRSFLNNKLDLNEAESLSDLIDSVTPEEMKLSANSLYGEMSKKISFFAAAIDEIRVRVEAEIDFSDEGQDYYDENLLSSLSDLVSELELFIGGCVNKKEASQKNNILLVGPVNSGKSSVFNRLLGFERAIVSSVPGTTRDMIGSELFYESHSFAIHDTAGVRKTDDFVEDAGIKISISEIDNADLVLGVFESDNTKDLNFFDSVCENKPFLKIQNKIDINKKFVGFDCCVSAKTGEGFDNLKKLIKGSFLGRSSDKKYNFLVRDRHEHLFNETKKNIGSALKVLQNNDSLELAAEELRLARNNLDELVGKKYSDSLLGDIFNNFCIGK